MKQNKNQLHQISFKQFDYYELVNDQQQKLTAELKVVKTLKQKLPVIVVDRKKTQSGLMLGRHINLDQSEITFKVNEEKD